MQIQNVIPGSALYRALKILAGAAILYLVLRALQFQALFAGDSEGLGALVGIIGTLYSVLYAFATYVIWEQFTAVESEILKEAGALKDLMLFSGRLPVAVREPVVRAVKTYARAVADTEWRALSRQEETSKTDRLFAEIVTAVTGIRTEDEAERGVYGCLLEIAAQASAHRDERLALSVKRMPQTLFVFVAVTACTILLLLFFYPFHSPALGLVSIAVTTLLLYFANFVLTDLDNPFEGTWNLRSEPFAELVTKYR